MSIFHQHDPEEPHHGGERSDHQRPPASLTTVAAAWGGALVAASIAAVIAVWLVNQTLYTAESTAEQYWDAVSSGAGGETLGMFESTPSALEDEQIDHLLLSGDALNRSAEQISSAEVTGTEEGARITFTADDQEHDTTVPLTRAGTVWGFFDDWRLSSSGLTWFEIEVPGAPQGGIGQIEVNGEPVNLHEDTARLSAFVPTVADITVSSQWLTGSAHHVVSAADESEDSAESVTLDLEASEDAHELLHEEIASFFEECADQAVLMPSGCPVGATTSHQVNAESIEWSFPDPDVFFLTFDDEGWQVHHDPLVAEVSFEARHYHTGEQLTVTEEVPFELSVRVGASGEDLIVSVSGS